MFKLRLYVPLILVTLFMSMFSVMFIVYIQEEAIHKNKESISSNFLKKLTHKVNVEAVEINEFIDFIQENKNVTDLFTSSNKQELYNSIKATYTRLNQNVELTHMYFIKPDGRVLLRIHDYDRDNDFIDRKTFKTAQKQQTLFYGLEFGVKNNYTLRVVKPWIVNGELIGYLELGKEINTIIDELSVSLNTNIYIAVKKDIYAHTSPYIKEQLAKKETTDNYYIMYKTANAPYEIGSVLNDTFPKIEMEFEDSEYYISKQLLTDVSNEKLGYFVLLIDVSLEHSIMYDSIKVLTGVFLIVSLVLIIGGNILIRKREKNINNLTLELEVQANHDALTGLPNRQLFTDRLNQAITKAQRNNTKMALFFIDLDHFKEINDSLGHDIGDKVLKVVTKKLLSILRKEDSLARLGGDEFTVIVNDLKNGEDASILAEKILKVLAEPIVIYDNELYVSSSIGISLYPDDGGLVQNLLKFADAAMYRAKSEGRNNFQFYSAEMTELAFERVVMETSLRAALKNEEFIVHFQPQVDGNTGKLVGMEALVRWNHATMGIISPAKFIPLAESTGLIVELDRFVMRKAMTQIALWYEKGLNPGVLAMNLAVKQLKQKDFISMFKNLMDETGCEPEWLELEVTESQLMSNPEEAIRVLGEISDLGVGLAIDDFGTGYSSLAYLKKLPIDKLKIDQSFVKDIPEDEDDCAITKAVISLSQSLNLRVIAEGVETQEQKQFLVSNKCNNIQGYLYSKPVNAQELEVILKNGL